MIERDAPGRHLTAPIERVRLPFMPDPQIPEITEVSFEFQPPRHGWLPLSIRLDQFALDLHASAVSNDPLKELIDWGQYVLDGTTGFRRVCFWLEPNGYALDVFASRLGLVKLRVASEESFHPPMATFPMKTEFACLVQRNRLAIGLYHSLSRFLDSAQSGLREHWHADSSHYARRIAVFRKLISAI